MADLAKWVLAAEPALPWPAGTFMEALWRAIRAASRAVVEGDPVAQALLRWVGGRDWTGSASELLAQLEDEGVTPGSELDRHRREKTWPASPRALSGTLTRLGPDLRRAGLIIDLLPEKDPKTRRTLWRIADDARATPAPEPVSSPQAPPAAPAPQAPGEQAAAPGARRCSACHSWATDAHECPEVQP